MNVFPRSVLTTQSVTRFYIARLIDVPRATVMCQTFENGSPHAFAIVLVLLVICLLALSLSHRLPPLPACIPPFFFLNGAALVGFPARVSLPVPRGSFHAYSLSVRYLAALWRPQDADIWLGPLWLSLSLCGSCLPPLLDLRPRSLGLCPVGVARLHSHAI